jgi:methylenetetrahydrofolate reductase (NADPH)
MTASILEGFSIEVMPRTLAKIDDLEALFPPGTRVYLAHIEGVDFQDMLAAAARLTKAGYQVMPHFPARLMKDVSTLENWIQSYAGEAGVSEALLLAGSPRLPQGTLSNSMQLLETGLFDKYHFKRFHVAGHPEGNKDIDAGTAGDPLGDALRWKQAFSGQTSAEMAIVTQFSFSATAVYEWAAALKGAGISLPIHIGIAGPTKLQTLIKFAISCGVGPSLKVLHKRAKDISKLLLPYEPVEIVSDLELMLKNDDKTNISKVHVFPLGGIQKSADWLSAELQSA